MHTGVGMRCSLLKNCLIAKKSKQGVTILSYISFIGFIGSIYTRIHFIHISLSECYYILNYKDHWDPGLFTSLHITLYLSNGVVYLDRL